jgi:hypothetical protein
VQDFHFEEIQREVSVFDVLSVLCLPAGSLIHIFRETSMNGELQKIEVEKK